MCECVWVCVCVRERERVRKIERGIEISISTPFNRRFMRNVAEVGSRRTSKRQTFVCRRKNVVDDSDDDGDDDDVD